MKHETALTHQQLCPGKGLLCPLAACRTENRLKIRPCQQSFDHQVVTLQTCKLTEIFFEQKAVYKGLPSGSVSGGRACNGFRQKEEA